MNEEMMFIACNVPKFLEEQMNKMKDALTGGMNKVQNTLRKGITI